MTFKMKKRIILPITSSLSLFLAGLIVTINFYLAILFLILGIFLMYSQAKNTPEIIARPEGSPFPNPKESPKNSLFVRYK